MTEKTKGKFVISRVPQKISRRSKSSADLRTIYQPPLEQKVQAKGIKRPIPLSIKDVNTAPKPKVSCPKIPAWDYRARYNELNERHARVVKDYSECKEIAADAINHKNKIDRLTRICSELESTNTSLKQQVEELILEKKRLSAVNATLQESVQRSTQEISDLTHELKQTKDTLNCLRDDHDKCSIIFKQLKDDKDGLQRQYDAVKDERDNVREALYRADQQRKIMHNTIQDLKGNIRVFCRFRPPLKEEDAGRSQCEIDFIDENTVQIRKSDQSASTKPKLEFQFDRVFGFDAQQSEVFDDLAQLVQSALDGYHICVFAYGQTGSGKTFTMQGSDSDTNAGMIPRTADLIFQRISEITKVNNIWQYDVRTSILEIYNDSIRDLLVHGPGFDDLKICYNEGKGTTVKNLSIVPVESASQLKHLMGLAHQNRATAATDFNAHSSRSHSVTKIEITGYDSTANTVYSGSINLVDLAGSESAKTSATDRLTETKYINRSLVALGTVMLALQNNESHIPYRNSKLTYLLQSSLGGNSKTLMFVNVSPFDDCLQETLNSLRFASRVKEVKMTHKKNKAIHK